jgi:CBS domain-containing protein
VEQVSPNEGVESIMVPYDEARPPLGDIQVRKVALRFLREQVLPIVDERGACIGVVFAEDCSEMDARLKDIMRPPPPMVTSSTPISKAITLLLDPQTKILVVLSSRTTYFPNKEDEVSEKVLGFVTKGMAFDLGHSHPFGSPS